GDEFEMKEVTSIELGCRETTEVQQEEQEEEAQARASGGRKNNRGHDDRQSKAVPSVVSGLLVDGLIRPIGKRQLDDPQRRRVGADNHIRWKTADHLHHIGSRRYAVFGLEIFDRSDTRVYPR